MPKDKVQKGAYSVESVNAVLNGKIEALWCAFAWEDTRHDHGYWSKRANGVVALTHNDKRYLRSLVNAWEKKQEKVNARKDQS